MLNAILLRSFLIGASAYALAPFTFGQVPIDESVGEIPILDVVSSEVQDSTQLAIPESNINAQLYLQLQRLQAEVQLLRGQVEDQGQLIKQLEQQRFDDFVALDQRLVRLEGDGLVANNNAAEVVSNSSSNDAVNASQGEVQSVAVVEGNESEARLAYDKAYAVLRRGDFADSKALFNDFLAIYPTSDLAANAYYWLGELAINDGELEIARQRFMAVVNNFPSHRKAVDANYKLGTVYYQLGQPAKSREYFERAAAATGQAASLAQKALESNF